MTTADNPVIGDIPIRRGFWDSDAQQGFGLDKAWHRHKIHSMSGMKFVMESPNTYLNGNQWVATAYVGRYECPDGRPGECILQEQLTMRGVADTRSFSTYYGWPAGDPLGMVTLYCENPDDAVDCPSWVSFALNYPGVDNPYSTSATADLAPTADPTQSAPAVAAQGADSGGEIAYLSSYEPLADTVTAP